MEKIAVWNAEGDSRAQQLAQDLGIPCLQVVDKQSICDFFLTYRNGCLKLVDKELLKKGGLFVDIDPRPGEPAFYPAPKQGALAQAVGKKTQTVVDATCGWGQDSLALFRMGYQLLCLERSPLMAVLLADGFARLAQQPKLANKNNCLPQLQVGDAIDLLPNLDSPPDCIYLDPMFPPKRKKSALSKKSMQVLQALVGQDIDKEQLFANALQATGKRVVVKSPDDAEPLGGKPDASFAGKLVRYDVYFR
jgi:16S rRNA (guanine1516-N2)-methyltransferase